MYLLKVLMTIDREFDMVNLLEACASWPNKPVTNEKTNDLVLERIRLILYQMQERTGVSFTGDLVALFRQVLLRRLQHRLGTEHIRVPNAQDGQFSPNGKMEGFR